MVIHTKFNKGDKVWFVLKDDLYTWGVIEDVRIFGTSDPQNIITNRFHNTLPLHFDDWDAQKTFTRSDRECFASKKEIILYMESEYMRKMSNIKQYSGHWYSAKPTLEEES